MSTNKSITPSHTLLLIGASRGIGYAMAAEFLERGWNVIGTIRGTAKTPLHDLALQYKGRVEIESLDITRPDEIEALRGRLAERRFDMLFVNAGTANSNQNETIAEVTTDDFVRVMITNALSPMRVIESLQSLVTASGLIGIMSSGQGSVSNNEKGGHEVYRGSKAALNMYMRSYAARHAEDTRTLVLMAPGWIRTALGGPGAPFSLEETVPKIVSTLLSQQGQQGLRYIDREGKTVPW
ncbi:SDR family oxidoreductase [Pseudomonas abietaniphila]|uniref:SDR family oxidoreductase n=1 Tax=Pseudomonas abietaniphila TaxID=89065 RepID=UPI00078390DC|nr:SDR family oxidoreductase [Pseudomonas abietaniphila]